MRRRTTYLFAALAAGATAAAMAIALFNLIVDPYQVFGTGLLPKTVESAERILKIRRLEHGAPIEAVIFGSSRAGTVPTDAVAAALGIPQSAVSNFSVSAGNMWDHLRHLRWMLAHGHPVRTVMLQLDLGEDYGRDRSGFQMLRMPHPEISGDSALLVAGDYLLRPHLRASMAKIEVNRGYGGQRLVHWPGGWWSAPERDALIEKDCPAHSAAHMGKTKLFAIGRASHLDRIAHNLSDLAAFLDVARAHRIKVIVYTTPFNRHALDQIDPDLYRQWLAGVARLTSFYNYAYYTPWANNDCLYYEDSHFTPALGRKLVADLFGDHAVGNRVTAENAASMLASAAENLRRNRAPRVDQVATRGLGPRQVHPVSETQSAGWDPTH